MQDKFLTITCSYYEPTKWYVGEKINYDYNYCYIHTVTCPNCGAILTYYYNQQYTYCPYCGYKLSENEEEKILKLLEEIKRLLEE